MGRNGTKTQGSSSFDCSFMSSVQRAYRILQILQQRGVSHLVMSPGSRNAPFMIALKKIPEISVHLQPDERSAGYTAMGIALASGKPVVACCTSGTAAANYLPSVVESYYQKVPLICLTADRPKEAVGQRNGQTIEQRNLYGIYIRYKIDLEIENDVDFITDSLKAVLNQNLLGPVHLNVAFKEPLYGDDINLEKPNVTFCPQPTNVVSREILLSAKKLIRKSRRPLLLLGQMEPDGKVQAAVETWMRAGGQVAGEWLCNIQGSDIIRNIDVLLGCGEFNPDLLVSIGRDWVSKKIKGAFEGIPIIHIEEIDHAPEPFGSISIHVKSQPSSVLIALVEEFEAIEKVGWKVMESNFEDERKHESSSWCDLTAIQTIMRFSPAVMHLGNSSVIRYAQLATLSNKVIYANRGTAGIDGTLSTAIGQAIAHNSDFLCLLGDVSFFYDSNALWLAGSVRQIKIVVINNGGGHIFSVISGPEQHPEIADWQQSPTNYEIGLVAKSFGFTHTVVVDELSLTQALSLKGHVFIEVKV
ncbi:MAG: 2-succinyl-5-enolpyruvyl-6-hydroxy-3-cyclohexene-1-carboxylic-acid synthase [Cryomorphaceae bacterium]|nr:2-succinyl-5-enolpyruvyl-6-hydroxy-3-cyclohexene-1-carboxylic-acid synthase [Cryomorphaceae bacterium]